MEPRSYQGILGQTSGQHSVFVLYSIVLVFFAVCSTGCATLDPKEKETVAMDGEKTSQVLPTEHSLQDGLFVELTRESVVESARALLGRKPDERVLVRGREFMLDCIGTVSATYWGAGYDLQRDFSKHTGNGVLRLHSSLAAWGALHEIRIPKPGDIVFWANTWDRNEDGKMYNDGITHAGIVIQVDEDGTTHYMHASVTRGVVIAFFNLMHPDVPKSPEGKIWNSPMYLGSNYGRATNPPLWLSGDLWNAFGDAGKTAEELRETGKKS